MRHCKYHVEVELVPRQSEHPWGRQGNGHAKEKRVEFRCPIFGCHFVETGPAEVRHSKRELDMEHTNPW